MPYEQHYIQRRKLPLFRIFVYKRTYEWKDIRAFVAFIFELLSKATLSR